MSPLSERHGSVTLCRVLSVYGILTLSVVLRACLGRIEPLAENNLNWWLIASMAASPLCLLQKCCRRFIPALDIPMLAYTAVTLLCGMLWHPESYRVSTTLYTAGYMFYFAMLARLIDAARFTAATAARILAAVVFAYAAVLLVQQACVACGFGPPNYIHVYDNPRKLASLAREPSFMVTTLCIVMTFYGMERRTAAPGRGLWHDVRRNPWLWAAYAYCLFTTCNASAYVAFPLSLLPWLTGRSARWIVPCSIAACGVLALVAAHADMGQLSRVVRLSEAVMTGDEERIIQADISASERIVPVLRTAGALNPAEADFWFGHGVDADTRDFGPTPLGFRTYPYALHVLYTYGLFAEMTLLWLIWNVCVIRRRPFTWIVAAAAVVYIALINHTAVWLILTLAWLFRATQTRRRTEHPSVGLQRAVQQDA